MKVYDRYDGREVDLPSVVEPGRYRIRHHATLNGTIKLAPDDLLWSDGGLTCAIDGDEDRLFVQPDSALADPEVPESVVNRAVHAVVDQWHGPTDRLPSPVMPAGLGELTQPTSLESELKDVLNKGHLQAIAARPRISMRYDSELLPVSRARRLSNDAASRLASHSEDWLRREITGVVPLTLKAEISEDDVVIYENIVFARLLDRLEIVLRRRLTAVQALQRKHDEASALSHAERLDYRLRDALCRLWGQSFADDPAAGKAAGETAVLIQELLGKIRQIRRSEVYAAIPRSQRVPMALRNTNILQHDPHYRRLRQLWLLAHATAEEPPKDASERFLAEKVRGERFAAYVGLLIRHALASCKLVRAGDRPDHYQFGARKLTLTLTKGNWTLSVDGATKPLTFVPALRGAREWSGDVSLRVVFCHRLPNAPDPATSGEPGRDGVLHPLEFYGVERARQAIEQWLMGALLSFWPAQVRAVPSRLRSRIVAAAGGSIRPQDPGLVVEGPVTDAARRKIEEAATEAHVNADTLRAIVLALDEAQLLATCRLCGTLAPASSLIGSTTGFKVSCWSCAHEWTLKYQQGATAEAAFNVPGAARPFDEVGGLNLAVKLR